MRIESPHAALKYLVDVLERTSTVDTFPREIHAMQSANGRFRFAVRRPNGWLSIVTVGPRGGLDTAAALSPSDWDYLRTVFP